MRMHRCPRPWLWLSLCLPALLAAQSAAGPLPANHELLTGLGLVRRRVAPSHHRKRLAAEMRSSGGRDDSHMVVIKLPPNPYYYAHSRPAKSDSASPNAVNKLAVSFQGNGKPTGVYHWNLPVLKKIKSTSHGRHGGASKRAPEADSKIYHIQKTSPFTHQASNEVHKGHEEAAAGTGTSPAFGARKQTHLKSKISYYTPRRKTMFHKYFQGNGKPHSFYVIEKSKKPVHYHRLMP